MAADGGVGGRNGAVLGGMANPYLSYTHSSGHWGQHTHARMQAWVARKERHVASTSNGIVSERVAVVGPQCHTPASALAPFATVATRPRHSLTGGASNNPSNLAVAQRAARQKSHACKRASDEPASSHERESWSHLSYTYMLLLLRCCAVPRRGRSKGKQTGPPTHAVAVATTYVAGRPHVPAPRVVPMSCRGMRAAHAYMPWNHSLLLGAHGTHRTGDMQLQLGCTLLLLSADDGHERCRRRRGLSPRACGAGRQLHTYIVRSHASGSGLGGLDREEGVR